MRRIYLLLLTGIMFAGIAKAQVTTNSGSGLNPTYPDLATAITALNGATMTSPVVITLTGNETAPAGGYRITQLGGTSTNTITIQGSSSTITAGLQTAGGPISSFDAIFKIVGGDWITIQSFTMQENAGNTVLTAGVTNTMTEFGVLLVDSTVTDGAQNNTIQNNIITLNSAYTNSVGIFSTSSSSPVNATGDATSTTGTNSNNKIYGNAISNVAQGILFICPPVTATVFETGNDIGGSSGATANSITFGNAVASSGPWNRSQSTVQAGIYFRNGAGNSVRFNSVTSNSAAYVGSGGLNGIMISSGSTPTGVTYTSTISDNTVNITTTGVALITGIDFGHGISTGTIVGSTNNVTVNQTSSAANSAVAIGIKANYASATNTCNSNTVVLNLSETTGAMSGAATGMTLAGTSTTITANSNNITINQTGSGTGTISSTTTGLSVAGTSTTNNVLTNTILINQTTSVATGISTAITGITATSAATTLNITTNNAITIKQDVTGAGTWNGGAITYINANATHGTANVTGNTLNTTASTIRSTGTLIGVNQDATITVLFNLKNNTMNVDRVAALGAASFTTTSSSPSEVADSISNNNITFTSLSGTSSVTAIASGGGPTTPNPNNKSICNNVISITGTNTGAAVGITASFTNTGFFRNNSITISTASASVTGFTTSSTAATVSGNTVSLTSSSTAPTSMVGVAATSTTGGHSVTANTFTTMTFNGVITGTPTITGLSIAGGTAANVFSNTVTNITVGAATSSANPIVDGILVSGGVSVNVFKNKIYGIVSNCTGATGVVNGVRISGGGSTGNNYYNNLIGGLTAPAATNPDAIRGISITSTTTTTTNNVYFNTVYLTGGGGTNFGATGIFHTASTAATTATLNLRNNIIVNNTTPNGTGLAVAYRRSLGTANNLANYASTSNNNLFFTGVLGGSATQLIYADGTSTAQTIAAYKGGVFTAGTIAPRDASSVTENPTFLSTTGSSSNFLHIDATVATQVESGGSAIGGFTDDYDGDTRNVSTPDLGADEGTFILSDLSGPSISYTALSNTLCLTAPSLSATITDASGVNITAGTKPRLWYRKASNLNSLPGTNDNTTDGWKYVEATNASSPFSFTIDYALLNGGVPVAGDIIHYFVVAQDLAGTPNLSINTGTFSAAQTTVALSAGAFPVTGNNTYTIQNSILTTVTVGGGGTYATLTAAGGLFDAINLGGLSGNTTATILGNITETGAIALNQIASCGGPFTLTIKPNTATTPILSGTVASGALIKLNGADNVIIDGSNNGTTTRDLTINNTSTTSPAGIWIASTGVGLGATNNTIKNCNITTGSNAATSYGIAIAGSSLGTGGADNDNVTIQNNNITQVNFGVWANGTATTTSGGLDNLSITGNTIGPVASGATNIGFTGINLANALTPSVTLNTVQNISATVAAAAGINTASTVVGGTISQNTVQNLNSTTAGFFGIAIAGASGSSFTVASNIVSRITGNTGNLGSTYVAGIEVTASSPVTLDKNKVDSVANNNTGTWGASGIDLNGGNNHIVKNNFVSNVNMNMSGGAAFNPQFGVNGIRLFAGNGHQVYHNTVNLYGGLTGTATTSLMSCAFSINLNTQTGIDVRNNIFSNTKTGGTTSIAHVAVCLPSGGTTAMGLTWNNNAYYTGSTAGVHGIAHGGITYTNPVTTAGVGLYTAANFVSSATTPVTNLRNYTSTLLTANTNNDNASYAFTTAAPFTTATDLHIPFATAGQLESGGVLVGVVVDIDNDTRPGPTGSVNGGGTITPDIGADEFDGTPAANMTYVSSTTTQANTSTVLSNSTNQEVIGIQIVTTGTLSPISATSFTINTNGTTAVADIANAKLWSTGTSSTFATTTQFGSTVAAPSGSFAVTGSQVLSTGTNYFWLTYDVPCTATAANVIDAECNSLTVVSAQTPTVQAPAGSRAIVVGALSGTKTVGGGGTPDFATLTAAAAAINTGGLSGNLTLSILGNLSEPGMVVINQWAECGAGNYTLTIKPGATITPTISASTTTAVIKLNGADRVTIDGSNTGGGTTKDMTITNTNTGTSSAVVWIASATGSDGATNNTIKNCVLTGNASTTTLMGIFSGGTASISTTGNALTPNTNNTIQNNTVSKAQFGIYVIGVNTTTLGSGLAITGNTLGSSTAGDGFLNEGIDVRLQSGASVSNNDVQNVNGSSTINPSGINIVDCQTSTVSANRVHNLRYTGTSTFKIFALTTSTSTFNTSGSQSANTYANNAVYDIASTATSGVWNVSGINNNGGYGDKYYFNSVSLTGSMNASGAGPSAAFSNGNASITAAASNIDVRNNIFYINATSGGTPIFYAHSTQATTYAGSTLDNNDLFSAVSSGGATAQLGFFNTANVANIGAWQTATTMEANSIGTDPFFNSATNLQPQTGSGVVGYGVAGTGILTDIVGVTRAVGVAPNGPTMGAYETAIDVTGPSITYTTLGNTLCNTDRTLSPVTITDANGVNTTAGTKPRLYFKKSTDANTYAGNTSGNNGWKYVEASNASSPFSFTTNYALLQSAVAGGDVIQYFVTAQDLAGTPNVSINSGIFNSTPTSVALAAGNFPITGTINSYTIASGGLSGTVSVGPSQTYTTLTAAGGLFAALNAGGLTGNLTANITGNITTEDGLNALNALNYGCAGPYTLTIKTTGTFTVSGTNSGGLIRINGADYVTIDGSTGSTANTVCPPSAASRDLTITNTNTSTGAAVVWIQTSATADPATNNTVKNCNISGDAPTTTQIGVGIGGPTVGSGAGANGNNNNSIVNNNISKVVLGIFTAGSGSPKSSGNIINQNVMNTASPNHVGRAGIMSLFEDNLTVSGNTISKIIFTGTGDVQGIGIGVNAGISTSTVTGGDVTNATITNNIVDSIIQSGTYSSVGIAVQATTSGTTLIANNMISSVNANGTSGDFAAAILVGGGTGSVTNVYHNTVTMTATLTGASYPSYALAIHGTTDPVVDVKSNIFTSTGTTGANMNRAVGINSSAYTNMSAKNNDLFVSGTGSAIGQTVTLANTGGTNHITLTDWQTNTGKDAASQNVFPTFVSPVNLHLVTPDLTNNVYLESMGTNVYATDIDCQSRPSGGAATGPDIGADEFAGATPACPKPTVTAVSSITATSASVAFSCVSCTGSYVVEYGPITPYWAPGAGALPGSGSSFVQPGGSSPIAISGLTAATQYKVYVRQLCSGSIYSANSDSTNLSTFTTLCAATTVPYLERFDAPTVAPAVPLCITVENTNGGNTWRTVTNLPAGDDPASYHNFMRLDYETDGITPANDWFFTRGITLTGGTQYRLRFHYRNSDGISFVENLEVKYGLSNSSGAMTTGTLFSHSGINSNVWKDTLVDFIPPGNGDYYIGFHGFSAADQAFLCVDNVSVILTPSCTPPVDVTITSITAGSGSVSFNSPGGTNFYVEYGAVGFTPGTGAGAGGGTVIGPVGASPVAISGLTPETNYDVYVRRDCGGSNFSPNSLPRSFKTIIGNDDAPGAYTLTLGSGCVTDAYTNVGATASAGEVFPSCAGTITSPVWFKFVAPASGAVRIKTTTGTGAIFDDSKVGLFSATNVADYTTFTILSCDEDGGSGGNDAFMSVVYATGLTNGTTYYIAVDKYNSSVSDGTFCITVDELSSSMLATSNTCGSSYQTPFGSNAGYAGWVPLVDGSSRLVALVKNPTGGEVDDYSVAQNINTAAVRQDATSKEYYLDRNFSINNSGGATNVLVKLFFLATEKTALKAVDAAANLSNLRVTRQTGSCANDFSGVGTTEIAQTDSGSINGVQWIGFTTPGFSNFYLHSTRAPIITKVFLQGAYDQTLGRHKDVTTTWQGVLNNAALVQPYDSTAFTNYAGGETVPGGFFTSNPANALDPVDWVLLEVKDVTLTTVFRRAALLREDGKIVDINGDTLITFNGLATGNYYLTIRHRNHLGISTQSLLPITSKALGVAPPTSVYDFDFSSAADANIFGDALAFKVVSGTNVMIAGNANSNGNVRYTGASNDPASILTFVGGGIGGIINNVYSRNDVNMNGTVRYTGASNDPGFMLSNALGGSIGTIVNEQKR